jgi:DNA primase
VSQDLETIHLLQVREWVFLAQWQDLETIHLIPLKVWPAQVRQDLVRQDLGQDLKVEHQDLEQDLLVQVERVQHLVEQNRDLVAVLQVEDSREEDQPAVAVAVLVEELLERLVRAEHAEAEEPESQSAPREKNSNKEVFQALVAQLCHAVMEQQLFACAVVHRFKTSQTRLMPMLVS